MPRLVRLLSFLSVGLIFMSTAAARDLGAYEAEAEDVLQRLRAAMMQEMQKAMAIGLAEAIGVRRHLAPEIEAAIEQDTGWEVRRTSLRVLNPTNAPDPEERGVLLSCAARSSAGQNPALLRTIRVIEHDGRPTVHFMQAVPMFDMCLSCHGSDITPEVTAAIRELYPDDQAVGYAVGEMRGAFSLFKPYDPATALASDDTRTDWTKIATLELPDVVPLLKEGEEKFGNPRAGRDAFRAHCRGCHAPTDLAAHLFGADWPADKPSLCVILESHDLTDSARDCDIVAFLQVLAETRIDR
ncbi:MAG: DUF3365 domain-containing protein [Alphaproteobacteria bacterium]